MGQWQAHLSGRIRAIIILVLLVMPRLTTADTGVSVTVMPVTVAPVSSMKIQRQVQLTGTVTAARNARLSTAISGLVQHLRVDAGSRVSAGDILLVLDAELAQVQQRGARARAEQASYALADAQRRLNEVRELAPQLSIAETVVRDLAAEVAEDTAAAQQARAEADYQAALLSRHTLKAPFAGVVSTKLTEVGEWVTPGQPVLELVAIDEVRLDFPVSEDYLAAVRVDSEVRFTLNAAPAKHFTGRVATVVPVTDPGARTFLLRILPEQAESALIPGMSVRANLQLPTGRTGLVVPRDATLRYPDGRTIVWSVESGPNGPVVRENLVQTGLQFDGLVEIRQGLTASARVVVAGNEALQAGQSVRVQPARAVLDG